MDAREPYISTNIQNMIKMICNNFVYKTYNNIGFVFTKYYEKYKEKKK